jgi:hypothetical protein
VVDGELGDPEADEPQPLLRPPGRRRLGRANFLQDMKKLIENPLKLLSL